MPHDRVSDTRPGSHKTQRLTHTIAPARLRQPAPVYLGHCPATRQVQSLITKAVRSGESVLVIGEPGTGKRTIAEILHHFSGGDLPLTQPTIADGRLGSIGDFSYVCPIEALTRAQQVELVDAMGLRRFVLGTRLDPDDDDARERLHPSLVHACPIHVRLPTLRDRIEDLEALALRIICESPSRRPIGGINDYALDCLRAHPWPGNVTELEDVMLRAIELGQGEQIELRDLPVHLRIRAVEGLDLDSPDLVFSLAHAERTAIERAMRYARGNKRKAARLLQIGKTTLYRKLRCYDADDDAECDDD